MIIDLFSVYLSPVVQSMQPRNPGLQSPCNVAGFKTKNTHIFWLIKFFSKLCKFFKSNRTSSNGPKSMQMWIGNEIFPQIFSRTRARNTPVVVTMIDSHPPTLKESFSTCLVFVLELFGVAASVAGKLLLGGGKRRPNVTFRRL